MDFKDKLKRLEAFDHQSTMFVYSKSSEQSAVTYPYSAVSENDVNPL